MLLLQIFFTFLKIGMFSFGGGYAMLPMIEKEIVNNHQWISYSDFIDIIGISQMTPGPIAINSATFVGFKVAGILGSVVATLGVVTFSFVIVSIATHYIIKFKDSVTLKSMLKGMKPALIGLIICAFLSLAKESFVNLKSILIGIVIAFISFKSKIHPIIVIVIAALMGLLLFSF
ncbi:chromate transporter [Clostridium frigidicarnis]|uniref:Chromate transporter n=2 Tax=Clostridium frigidicarnis TaxID=84698 RepID=A0A1I0W9I8_9CLOT|nr:chromate transporter [Clostridium frigidicarnis]